MEAGDKVAKVVRRDGPSEPKRPKPPTVAGPTPGRGGYFREVAQELRKTSWPTWPELTRMTGVVIATVLLFAAIVGIADLGLTTAVKPLYLNSSANASAAPSTGRGVPQISSPTPAKSSASASAKSSGSAAASATAHPSATATATP